jgi:hypothetical protein
MEENKFFKWIWRIVAIGLLLMIITGLYGFIRNEVKKLNRPNMDRIEPVSTLAKDPQKVEKWVLRTAPYVADNSDYTILSLYSQYNKVKNSDRDYYATTNNVVQYHGDSLKNILFVNIKENSSSWLFPTNNQLILDYDSNVRLFREGHPYYLDTGREKVEKATFIYYKLINKDTNGDKIITEADHLNFAVSDTSGKNYRVVVEDMEIIISMKTINKETMSLIYQKDGIAHSLQLNTNSFEIILDVVLPKVGV